MAKNEMNSAGLKKGNINDFIEASRENISFNPVKLFFDKQILKSIKLSQDSMIAKCTFIEAYLIDCVFENVHFVKCDFSKADMFAVSFINCIFDQCAFNECKFKGVKFDENCKLNLCTFNSIDPASQNAVTGINPDDFKVIVETPAEKLPALIELGFSKIEDEEYCLKADSNDQNSLSLCVVVDSGTCKAIVHGPSCSYLTQEMPELQHIDKNSLKDMFLTFILPLAKTKVPENASTDLDNLASKIQSK